MPQGQTELQVQDAQPRGARATGSAWVTSALLHTMLFVLLAFIVLPSQVNQLFLSVQSESSGGEQEFEFAAVSPVSLDLDASDATSMVDVSLSLPEPVELDPLPKIEVLEDPELLKADLKVDVSSATLSLEPTKDRKSLWETREPTTTDSIAAVDGVAAALGPIEQAIRDEVARGDTLVVWLMDASISLQLNRRLVAARLAEFQTSLGLANRKDGLRGREQSNRLFNSVIAFGQNTLEVQGPTLTGLRAVEKIARLPSDPSGVEMTMSAVNQVVALYRGKQRRRERMLIVLLTDESGDDGMAVEGTIANCRNQGVAVHVIGPTAVMGLEEGTQLWTSHAYDQPYQFLLKVKRGPETCLPERAFVPYWHENRLSAWRPDVRPANAVPWYGGEYREGVLSGFGPYTLTRLALQTGGSFTLYDRGVNDRYSQETLRRYFPEYGSLDEYQASIQTSPLRMFVAETAAVTLGESNLFLPLRMMFFGSRDNRYPFAPRSAYMNPTQFRRSLPVALEAEKQRARQALGRISQLLTRFEQEELEYEYAKEESPRWKAWYDLNRGRLLAAAVRYDEYIAACNHLIENLPQLGKDINEVMLLPSRQYRVSSSEGTAGESVRLLKRCQQEHASTPWDDLAGWELATEFGIGVRTQAIPRPKPPPPTMRMGLGGSMGLRSTGGGGGQSFSFPSL